MKSRGIFYKIKQNTKQNTTHRRDEFTSRRRALLYCIRFCYSLFIMSKKHYCSTPTVPLSYENPQHYQRSEFVVAHSRKVGTVSGDPPQNLHSTIAKPRPFHYPAKIRNVIKGRNSQRRPAKNLHSTIAKPRPFCYPSKIRNIIKGRNLPRPTGAYSWSAKL